MTPPEPPPAGDNIDMKADAHRVAVGALSDVVAAVQRSVQRLRLYEEVHAERWGTGSTLAPVRGARVALSGVAKILTPILHRAQRQTRQFDQSNYEPEQGRDVSGR